MGVTYFGALVTMMMMTVDQIGTGNDLDGINHLHQSSYMMMRMMNWTFLLIHPEYLSSLSSFSAASMALVERSQCGWQEVMVGSRWIVSQTSLALMVITFFAILFLYGGLNASIVPPLNSLENVRDRYTITTSTIGTGSDSPRNEQETISEIYDIDVGLVNDTVWENLSGQSSSVDETKSL